MNERLAAHWDKVAPRYDLAMAYAERRFFGGTRAWICSRSRGRTLEVAVGTLINLDHYPSAVELSGIDWSESMISIAADRARRAGRTVDLRQGDAVALPYEDESYDTVVCTFALCCIPDDKAAIAEMLRVLRPGGRLLLADHVVSTSLPVRALQRATELITGPLHGEYWTRRPRRHLTTLEVPIVESQRMTYGAVERIHARKAGPAPN
ncbi:MAG: class I SAM-dependent methyltransferase [Propionibacteriales bacterium]|nr:class I SAM-dependent methyltransferase [Propionibacteriales bacterium]